MKCSLLDSNLHRTAEIWSRILILGLWDIRDKCFRKKMGDTGLLMFDFAGQKH